VFIESRACFLVLLVNFIWRHKF